MELLKDSRGACTAMYNVKIYLTAKRVYSKQFIVTL